MSSTTPDESQHPVRRVLPGARQSVVVGFSILLTLAIIGPGVVMLPGVDSDHGGTAAAAQSSNSGVIYTGSYDNDVKALNASDGSVRWTFTGHSSTVHDVSRSPDNSTVYTASTDGTVRALDASTGAQLWNFTGHTDAVYTVSPSPGGDVVYTGSFDQTVKAVNASTGTEIWSSSDPNGIVYATAVSRDGEVVYSAGSDSTVRAHDSSDGSELWNSSAHSSTVNALAMSPGGERLFSGSSDNTTKALDPDNGNELLNFTGHTDAVESVAASPDGSRVYSASADNTVRAIDVESGTEDWSFTGHTDTVGSVSPSADGDVVYSGGYDTTVKGIDASTGGELWSASPHSDRVISVDGGSQYETVIAGDVKGRVLDQNGDPVENATVYSVGYDTANPPKLDTRNLEEVLDSPLPKAWQRQIDDIEGFTESPNFDANDAADDWEDTRVLMHTSEDWELATVPLTRGKVQTVPPDVQARAITTPDDEQLFACWRFDGLREFGDGIDDSIVGGETTPCDSITIQRIDPLNDSEYSRTVEPEPLIESRAAANVGWSSDTGWGIKHHYGYRTDLDAGVYRVYPEDKPGKSMLYVVAPNNDPSELRAEMKNLVGAEIERRTKFNNRMEELYNDGSIDVKSTTTNETGYYGLDVDTNIVTHAEIRAVKGGSDLNVDPQNLSEDHLRENFEDSVRRKFNDATAVSFEDADQGTFQSVCERMDSVLDDVGSPFYGQTSTAVPNDDADIQGVRVIPPDTDPRVRQCAAFNIAEQLAQDPLGLLPGFSGDLSDLTDQELLEYARRVLQLVNANPDLKSDIEDALGTDLPDNPDDLNDPETARDILNDGLTVVDSPGGDTNYGGGDGGFVGGGDAPNVQDPEESADRVNETISRTWPVTGVDNWENAGVLLRIEFSDGSEELLTPESEYLSVEEHAVGPDHVHLDDYPFNTSDAAVARLSLDVATEAGYDRDRGRARNPNFDGTIPALQSVRVSSTSPGKADTITVAASPERASEWGGLQYVNVTGPNCEKQVNASNDAASIEMCGAGIHRLAVTYRNADGTPFTEVLQVEALTTSQARPPAVRAASGVTGRFAVVGNGLTDGRLEVTDGTSQVVLTGILPADSDVPSRIMASTTGVDVARDATTTIRLRQGPTEETIRERVGVLLHVDRVADDSLLYRNGRPIRNPGETADALVEHRNRSTVIDSYTGTTAEMTVEVSRDPGLVERIWHGIRLRFPSLPVGLAVVPLSGTGAVAVVLFIGRPVRRRLAAATSGDQEAEA